MTLSTKEKIAAAMEAAPEEVSDQAAEMIDELSTEEADAAIAALADKPTGSTLSEMATMLVTMQTADAVQRVKDGWRPPKPEPDVDGGQ